VRQTHTVFPYKTLVNAQSRSVLHSSSTAVYTITYTITATNEDVYVPSDVVRLEGAAEKTAGVHYEILDGDNVLMRNGISGALLYSRAKREDAYYIVPQHTSEQFTLVVVYKHTGTERDVYHIHMRGFDFSLRSSHHMHILEREGFLEFRSPEIFLQSDIEPSSRS
jgi:hypothetical protein